MTTLKDDLEKQLLSLSEPAKNVDEAFVGQVLLRLPDEESERLRKQQLEALIAPEGTRSWWPMALGLGVLAAAAWFVPASLWSKPFVEAMNYQWGDPLPMASLLILGSIAALLTKPLWEEA